MIHVYSSVALRDDLKGLEALIKEELYTESQFVLPTNKGRLFKVKEQMLCFFSLGSTDFACLTWHSFPL
jgi:hypothetical protein